MRDFSLSSVLILNKCLLEKNKMNTCYS